MTIDDVSNVKVFDRALDLSHPDVRYLVSEIARLQSELDAARGALTDALEGWREATAYKSDFLRDKHGDLDEIERLSAALEPQREDAQENLERFAGVDVEERAMSDDRARLVEEVVFHPLVETLADVMAAGLKADLSGEEIAQDVLAAIDASGTHWLAPWDQNAAMIDAAAGAEPPAEPGADTTTVDWIKAEWVAQRDAYLAEQTAEREDTP